MKNIHLLPTDKPGRLQKTKHNNFFLANRTGYEYTDCTAQHIYITSDEEIKEEDWVISIEGIWKNTITKIVGEPITDVWKKIILTTDPDLIKDGVQAIDDEFLEWFVKNPSCEWVEVKKRYSDFTVDPFVGYKIIIPKVEPKQETLEEAAENYSKITLNKGGLMSDKQVNGFIAGAKWQQEQMERLKDFEVWKEWKNTNEIKSE